MTLAAFVLASIMAHPAEAPAALVETPVLVRTVDRGEVLDIQDFQSLAIPRADARDAIAPSGAAGLETLRRIDAGTPVRAGDLVRPQLVRRGDPVTLLVRSEGLEITAPGRALAGGARGDLVRAVNIATGRTIDGNVEKAGTVRIAAPGN